MGVQIPHGKGKFEGEKGASHCNVHSAVTCAKTAEPIVMLFGLWAQGIINLIGSRSLHEKGQYWGKGSPIVDLGRPKEVQVHWYSSGAADVPSWEGTLAPPGEHD